MHDVLFSKNLQNPARDRHARALGQFPTGKKIMHRVRAARPCGFDSLPSLDPN
jgi:hypothetical protein